MRTAGAQITWYRDGVPVVTANENPSSHRMLLPSGQLFFLRVIHNKNARPDVGTYYCNATNPDTHVSVVSRSARLAVAGRSAALCVEYLLLTVCDVSCTPIQPMLSAGSVSGQLHSN